jgi:Protein of unknown function (DUF3157)
MKSVFLIGILLTISALAVAQQTATTQDGRTVLLNDDGTWKYQDKPSTGIEFNDSLLTKYTKSVAAKTLLKSERTNHAIWYNSSKWSTIDLKPTDASEYVFKLKDKDGYCITIVEKIEMQLVNFREIMLKNLRMRGAEAIDVIKEEYRIVNGNRVLHMQFDAIGNGVKFSYTGYYFSNEKGTTQLLCYTAKNLFSEYKQEFENMLNGFTVIPE